jgi:zinc protease
MPRFEAIATATPSSLSPFYEATLPGGFRLIVREMPHARVTSMAIGCRAGAAHEPPDLGGISHFLEHMFFKGSELHGRGEMDRIVKELGGYLNAATSLETTTYLATVPAEHTARALELLADALLHSAYDPIEIEREREVIGEEQARKEDSPQGKLFVEFQARIGAGTPYGRPVLGTPASLARIDREALATYFAERYTASNLVLVVAGPIDRERIGALAESLFAAIPSGTPNRVAPFDWLSRVLPDAELRDGRIARDVRHSYLMLGFRTPGLPERETVYALEMAGAILGRGRSSRLVRRLREELGIVSSVSAWTWDLSAGGMLVLSASLDPTREPEVRAEIEAAIRRLGRESVGAEEWARARTLSVADFRFANETPADVAGTLTDYALSGRAEDALDYAPGLERATPEAMRAVVRRTLDLERAVMVLVGPPAREAAGVKGGT